MIGFCLHVIEDDFREMMGVSLLISMIASKSAFQIDLFLDTIS